MLAEANVALATVAALPKFILSTLTICIMTLLFDNFEEPHDASIVAYNSLSVLSVFLVFTIAYVRASGSLARGVDATFAGIALVVLSVIVHAIHSSSTRPGILAAKYRSYVGLIGCAASLAQVFADVFARQIEQQKVTREQEELERDAAKWNIDVDTARAVAVANGGRFPSLRLEAAVESLPRSSSRRKHDSLIEQELQDIVDGQRTIRIRRQVPVVGSR